MMIEERAEYAAELKATGQCNCTQAVLKAFEDKLPVNSEELMKLTAGFAAGMGCMESTCGALIGAIVVAGDLTEGKEHHDIPGRSYRISSKDAVERSVRS